jgi:serpin B
MSIPTTIAIVAILLCGVVLHAAEPESPAAAAINSLGIDLLQRTGKPDANALLSPYSIQSALAMAYAGADGATRDEMAKVLHYPKDEAKLHLSLSALQKALDEAAQQSAKQSAQVKNTA